MVHRACTSVEVIPVRQRFPCGFGARRGTSRLPPQRPLVAPPAPWTDVLFTLAMTTGGPTTFAVLPRRVVGECSGAEGGGRTFARVALCGASASPRRRLLVNQRLGVSR